ncbi:copper chaperone PCu(A)C [Novosphingobium colocasiae]|uniref:Copper chaperone PCu(A)C n=1 Tax=Novosphingobium colocasiae TaxID=1256513 RepID=A0A918PBD9_9SPHN|nr:copper chaperone PCu(A)C [Novosphingobium colocasiae]GGY97386.1 hypothetical protein GCM10011614_10480 [Novosphingobium colocasiae]
MNNLWKPRRTAPFALSLAAALTLAACSKTPEATDSGAATAAPDTTPVAGPDAKPGIAVSDGKLVLPAVPGRPGVVYFTVRNGGPGAATLAGVDVSGAGRAEIHKTDGGTMSAVKELQLEPGADVTFAPGGLHVMVFDLDPKLKSGGAAELTLTFADGDKASLPLTVSAMGEDSGGMAGHDMSGHDMGSMEGMTH